MLPRTRYLFSGLNSKYSPLKGTIVGVLLPPAFAATLVNYGSFYVVNYGSFYVVNYGSFYVVNYGSFYI